MDLQPLRFPTREMAAASFNEAAQILGEDSVRLMERIEAYTALYEQWKTKISNILKEGKNDRFEEIYRGDQRTTYERSRFHEADSTEGEERTYSNYRNNNFRKEQQTLSEEEGGEEDKEEEDDDKKKEEEEEDEGDEDFVDK